MNQQPPYQQFQAQTPVNRPVNRGMNYTYAQQPYGQPPQQHSHQGRPSQPYPQQGRQQGYSAPPPHSSKSPKPRKKMRKWPLIVVAVLVIGGLGYYGVQTLRNKQVAAIIAPYEEVFAPNIIINGIDISGMKPEDARDRLISDMQQKVNSWSMNLTHQGHVFASLNYGSLGITVDENQLYGLLNEAWSITHTGDVHQRKAAIEALQNQPYQKQVAQSELNDQQLEAMLNQIAPYINKHPVDAAIMHFQPDNDDEPFIYQHEQAGARFDVAATKAEIMQRAATGQSGDFELKGEPIPPSITVAQLKERTTLRSSVSTDISTSSEEDRNNNIRVSLSRMNGMILKPGETFSFNKVVGPRTLKAGFFEAPEQVYGELVTGVGGGVCQSSTTLYQAALTAGLTISKRSIHSEKVGYSDLGQDATVYLYGGREIDFAFKNTSPDNIYIAARVRPAKRNSKRLVTEIKLYGLSLGDGVSYRMVSETVETIPAPIEKKYVVDESGLIVTYKNQEKEKSKAQDGYVVVTYLEKLQNGQVIERNQVSKDRYEPKQAVYYRGNTTPSD